MKTAYTFYCNDFALVKQRGTKSDSFVPPCQLRSIRIRKPDLRTAEGARIRLGMKTPVLQIRILTAALGAHNKRSHCGLRTIIGKFAYNSVTGTTVGTVDKRVAIPAVFRILHLGKTLCAHSKIGRNQGGLQCFFSALHYLKTSGRTRRLPFLVKDCNGADEGRRRVFPNDSEEEAVKILFLAMQFHLDAVRGIQRIP